MKRYLLDWINDDLAVWDASSWTWPSRTLKTYDPEKFNLVPKESYKRDLIKQREQEIEEAEKRLTEKKNELKALKSG